MSNRFKSMLFLLGDTLCLYFGLIIMLAIWLKFDFNSPYVNLHLFYFTPLFICWIITYFIEGLYSVRSQNPARLVAYVARSTAFNVLISFIYFYIKPTNNITPKTNLIILGILVFALLVFWRRLILNVFTFARFKSKIYLVAKEINIKKLTEILQDKPHFGYELSHSFAIQDIKDIEINIKSLKKNNIQMVVVDRIALKDETTLEKVFNLLQFDIEVMDLSSFMERLTGEVPIESIEHSWFLEYCGCKNSKSYRIVKNIFDKSIAIIIAVLIAPFYGILLLILLVTSGRPIFFKQERVGHFNKLFTLYKLRSMTIDAEKDGAKWATPNDARVTKIGKFLRKTRLDEIPQLWNIIKGDMSLVGPRPERPEFTKELSKKIPFYNERHLVKPGVTGWAQINFRYGFSEDDSAQKLKFDLYYIKNKSIWMDFAIFLKTVKTVLTGAGQ